MAQKPYNIIIVGGSLAGLLCGTILKTLWHASGTGISITILERSPTSHLQHQGAGIVFGSEAHEFFERYSCYLTNPAGAVGRKLSVTSRVRQTLGRDGGVVSSEERAQEMVNCDLLYFLLRRGFDGLESGYVDGGGEGEGDGDEGKSRNKNGKIKEAGEGKVRVRYLVGSKVTGVKDLGDEVEVEFESADGSEGRQRMAADLVLAADGPSSTIRSMLMPDVKREYAGYVAWRGTILESQAAQELLDAFAEKFTFFHGLGTQILAYLIPGENGTLEQGQRLINWVWYCNYPRDSKDFVDLFTDAEGKKHHFTMPARKLKPHLWEQQIEHAESVLPSVFSSLVAQTEQPFVQAITDVISPQCSFFNDKLLLVGDALAGFRPHTAASTNQAAYHALLLRRWFCGEMEKGEVLKAMMDYARDMQDRGVRMGNRSQFQSLDH